MSTTYCLPGNMRQTQALLPFGNILRNFGRAAVDRCSWSVASPRGGGQAGQLDPPPILRSDTPWDLCRSEEIFMSGKKWGYVYRICSHILHVPTLWWTFFGLTITKKKTRVIEVVQGVTLVGPQWSCGALWDLSVMHGPFQIWHLFLIVNLGPSQK